MKHLPPSSLQDDLALPNALARTIEGLAAPFSTWFLHSSARALFDAGEGIASRLGNRVFSPEAVFLTHAHYDHVSGLAGFLLSRTVARGDKEKPLTIYYPRIAETGLKTIRTLVDDMIGTDSPFTWRALEVGEGVPLRHWVVEPFAVNHSVPAVGYRILERRERLKPKYRGESPGELQQLRRQGVEIHETYRHVVFAITGDTGPGLSAELFQNADVLFHESAFLQAEDRREFFHSTTEEAFALACEANVKNLVLYHFSQRYRMSEIRETVCRMKEASHFSGNVAIVAGFTHAREFY